VTLFYAFAKHNTGMLGRVRFGSVYKAGLESPSRVAKALLALGCFTATLLIAWGAGISSGGSPHRMPLKHYTANLSDYSAASPELANITNAEDIFGFLLSRVANISARAQAAASSAEGAGQKVESLEQRVEEAQQNVLGVAQLIMDVVSNGSSGRDVVAAVAAEQRAEQLEQQLEQAEKRRREAEEKLKQEQRKAGRLEYERNELTRVVDGYFQDVRTSTQADKHMLWHLLRTKPSILEERRKAMASAPQRGILLSAGLGSQLANAFVNLFVLRQHLKCTLPVAIT
jgi:hypothetical protein